MFFFIPLGTTRPRLRTPFFTYGLIAVNAAVFVAQAASEDPFRWAFVPAHPSLLAWFAALFMHGSPLHLAGNMLFLWLFGSLAEDAFGPWLFLAIYFGGNLGATALDAAVTAVWAPASLAIPHLGASGAIAGIMGLAALCFTKAKVRVWYAAFYMFRGGAGVAEVGAPVFVGVWVLWEVAQGLVSTYIEGTMGPVGGAAHWAHLGGFLVGAAAALAMRLPRRVVRDDLFVGREAATDSMSAYAQLGELEEAVREESAGAEAWYALGRAREVSGLGEQAEEAYTRAAVLFLREGRLSDAVRAYRGAAAYGGPRVCPVDALFDLACALEETGHPDDARRMFLEVAARVPRQAVAETALVRAAELARTDPAHDAVAAECYQRLLRDHPNSPWADFCREQLRELSSPRRSGSDGEDTIRYTRA